TLSARISAVRPRGDVVGLAGARAVAGIGAVALSGRRVTAGGAIGSGWVRAGAGRRITYASQVTLVARRADDGVAAGADTGSAGVGLSAGIAVAAGRPVRGLGVRAGSRRGVACARLMALVARRASDRVGARADTGPAGVDLGAGVA